jgi:hypothetical protein
MSQEARHRTTTIIIAQVLPADIVVFDAKSIAGPPNQHHRRSYYPATPPDAPRREMAAR